MCIAATLLGNCSSGRMVRCHGQRASKVVPSHQANDNCSILGLSSLHLYRVLWVSGSVGSQYGWESFQYGDHLLKIMLWTVVMFVWSEVWRCLKEIITCIVQFLWASSWEHAINVCYGLLWVMNPATLSCKAWNMAYYAVWSQSTVFFLKHDK